MNKLLTRNLEQIMSLITQSLSDSRLTEENLQTLSSQLSVFLCNTTIYGVDHTSVDLWYTYQYSFTHRIHQSIDINLVKCKTNTTLSLKVNAHALESNEFLLSNLQHKQPQKQSRKIITNYKSICYTGKHSHLHSSLMVKLDQISPTYFTIRLLCVHIHNLNYHLSTT